MKDIEAQLITAWEAGRAMATKQPSLAASALAGELPVLPYKGGVEKAIKGSKVGTLFYLAMWQGLRGEDLSIDTDARPTAVCSRHGVTVHYSGVLADYVNA